jgi:hypothetical protein
MERTRPFPWTSAVRSLGMLMPALASAQDRERVTVLAQVPEELQIASDLRPRNGLGFRRRPSLAWSADGRTVAYAALRGDEYLPVVGAELGAAYDYVGPPVAAGGHVFFLVARRKDEDEQRCWLWVDGKTIGPEDWMGDPVVRADGRQVVFWTGPGSRVGNSGSATSGKHVLVQASDKGSQWSLTRGSDEWREAGAIRLPTSGDVCSVGLARTGEWFVFRAGKKEPRRSEGCAAIESFDVSADGEAVAYVSARPGHGAFPGPADGTELYFRGKRVGKAHAVVASATLDAAGERVAYVVTRDGARRVAIGEEPEPRGAHGFVLELAFDPRGESLAYVAVDGGREDAEIPGLVAGGRWSTWVRPVAPGSEPHAGPAFHEIRDLRWDARTGRLAYAARDDDGWRIVSGDLLGSPHDDVGPPEFVGERTLAFGCRDGAVLAWRELDLP